MLTWNAEKVENFKEKNEKHGKILDGLVWAALAIGMNEIKKDNVKEWVYRINRFRFEGHPLFIQAAENGGVEYPVIEEGDVEMWIGLKTNVTTISNTSFDAMLRKLTGR